MKNNKYLHITESLNNERSKYADRWNEKNSIHFEKNHYYDWMSKFLEGHSLVLEVGTGTGQSTISLLKNGHSVVSIDENPNCLIIAEKNIKQAGFEVYCQNRGIITPNYYGYNIKYRQIQNNFIDKGAFLIEGDIVNDPLLHEWLIKKKPFDAVICWLIGTHNDRQLNKVIINSNVRDDGSNRLFVQNEVYETADRILKSGGILQIVDRGENTNEPYLIQDALNAHKDQASTTSLVVESIELLPYEEPSVSGSQPMIISPGISGRVPKDSSMAFWSIISRKP